MPSTTAQPSVKRIKLSDLDVDKRYQRPLDEARVARIAKSFEPALCGTLEVSSGSNGSFAVFDGQHRLAALKLIGEPNWLCRVHALDAKQQAELFVRLQTERRPVHPLDRHKAAVFAKDAKALAITGLVRDAGYTITGTKVFGGLSCIGALNLCYDRYGADALKSALRVIDETWGRNDHYARKAPMVTGMTLLLARYGDVITPEDLIEKLKSTNTSAVEITSGAQTEMRMGARSTTERVLVARQILEVYNRRRRHLTEEELAEGRKPTRISPQKLGRDA